MTRSSLGRVVGTGVLVGLAVAVLVVWDGRLGNGAWQTPSRVAAPAGLVILLVVVAGWLLRSDLDGWVAIQVPVTTLLGVVVFGGVAWGVTLDSATGSRTALVVLNFAGAGGAVGVLIGLFTAKQSATIRSLHTARDEYRALFDGIGDTVIVHDTRGRIIAANEVAAVRLGCDPSSLEGRSIDDVEGDAAFDGRHAAGGDRLVYETVHVTADGGAVPVEVSARLVRYHDAPAVLSVARDISERRASERELSQARDQLRALNRVLRHDIRNDMQIVLGHAELLDDHVDEAGRDHLETITDTGEHVVELTRSSRDLARTVAGGTELPLEAVSLSETLRGELDRRRKVFTDAELVLEGDVPDVEVRANDLLSSVFRNLLNNAVQHSDRDEPTVTVSADLLRGPHRVRVRVADDGPGIPAELEDDVFGRGQRGLESEGTGLGLYLVESLVDHYGGEVWVEENDPRGTVVVVELPLADRD
ncbi:two-component system sensor histidine kinase NtrB [Haloplanus litoreus]|uniref:histidine kinase n=1 Tax=Haloplanus litoreus TaxID=767515 RepID=A0ABD6A2T9_9EURY